jgi:prepilin-type N-terminal cleavage/methylation domain-containing protein
MNLQRRVASGLTLIELMVVVAILAVLVAVAAPSVRKLLDVQRMRGHSAQLTTDIQFVRTEAASRQEVAGISFRYVAGSQSCYTIHTCGSNQPTPAVLAACVCDCTQPAGSRCPAASVGTPFPPLEIKTVSVPTSRGVIVTPTSTVGTPVTNAGMLFDPTTGSMVSIFPSVIFGPPNPPPGNFIGVTRLISPAAATGAIRTEVNSPGRPRTCNGLAACP